MSPPEGTPGCGAQAGRVELVNANAPSFGIRSGARYW